MENIWHYPLIKGHTDDPSRGACAMAAISWLVYGKHSDAPECVDPYIKNLVINANDHMPDDIRQKLIAYLPRIAGSKDEDSYRLRHEILYRMYEVEYEEESLEVDNKFAFYYPDKINIVQPMKVSNHEKYLKFSNLKAEFNYNFGSNKIAYFNIDHVKDLVPPYCPTPRVVKKKYIRRVNIILYCHLKQDWDEFFKALEEMLNAGKQGEPWSADFVEHGQYLFEKAREQALETV